MTESVLLAEDSRPIPPDQEAFDADWLSRLADESVEGLIVRLVPQERESERLVYSDRSGRWHAGRYIGDVDYAGRRLSVRPRFGFEDIAEWLAEVLHLPVVPDLRGKLEEGPFLDHLLAITWGSGLVRAAKHGLPLLRRPVRHVGHSVRGRLKVRETLGRRARGQPNLVSETTERDLDNPIVRTAMAAYQVLHRRLVSREMSDDEWIPQGGRDLVPAMLRACGPRPEPPSRREIRRIRYSPITETYRPFVALSEQIARLRGGIPEVAEDRSEVSGLLLDVAELWELYVFHTARAGLSGVRVVHGTAESEERWQLGRSSDGQRLQRLVPDVVVERDARAELIADAKYKSLAPRRDLGRPRGYEHGDLYQLITYLTEAVCEGQPNGWLVYPREEDGASVEESGPWTLRAGQRVSFVQLPRKREAARLRWAELFSDGEEEYARV